MVKVKEIKPLRGGVACYAAQAMAPIDAEIGQKDHLGMETGRVVTAEMTHLVIASAAVFLIAWLVTRAFYSARVAKALGEYRAQTAALTETVRGKTAELHTLAGLLDQAGQELKTAQTELRQASEERASARGQLQRLAPLEEELKTRSSEIAGLHEIITGLKNRQAKLETIIVKERRAAQEKIALLGDVRTRMTDTYRSLAASALRENNQVFLDLARTTLSTYLTAAAGELDQRGQTIDEMVRPLREALVRYDQQVQSLERAREHAYGGLAQQLHSLTDSQQALQRETGKLVKALRLPHVRGRWGEMTLKRVAELAGLQNRCDFFEQPSVQTEDGLLRPDMVVALPGRRQIVVDAKVPLASYLDVLETESDVQRAALLAAHARQVQTHVQKLAQKSYWAQFKPTPEFVVLFIPGENFFSAALAQAPQLIEESAARGVILATPTTLIALLKTIAFGWRQEAVAENAQLISDLGRELYERLSSMTGHMNRLGRELERCTTTYNQVIGTLERRVLPSGRKFKELGVYVKGDRQLPTPDRVVHKPRTLETDNG